MNYSIYRTTDGLFTGRTLHLALHASAKDAAVKRNLGTDEAAIEGTFDHLSQKVDLTTGEVVRYQPPQPSPDHEWNARGWRWQLKPEVNARQIATRDAMAKIQALEIAQHRPMREALLGDVTAHQRVTDIDRQIVALREHLKT